MGLLDRLKKLEAKRGRGSPILWDLLGTDPDAWLQSLPDFDHSLDLQAFLGNLHQPMENPDDLKQRSDPLGDPTS